MKKIDLKLDYDLIIERIDNEKKAYKPSQWAEMVGVSKNIVSNIHGKTKQKPSLEYIIAVSRATNKPIEYYLFGLDINTGQMDPNPKIANLLTTARKILNSKNKSVSNALETTILSFDQLIHTENRLDNLESEISELKSRQKRVKRGV